jgi:hypothetical protein
VSLVLPLKRANDRLAARQGALVRSEDGQLAVLNVDGGSGKKSKLIRKPLLQQHHRKGADGLHDEEASDGEVKNFFVVLLTLVRVAGWREQGQDGIEES